MHYHIASGLAGYGPDCDESTPTFDTLGDALDFAREELLVYIDIAHDTARAYAEYEDYKAAWLEILRIRDLESYHANFNPARKDAPLYRGDPVAYAKLQDSQAAEFPIDVTYNSRLYLWDCDESECEENDA